MIPSIIGAIMSAIFQAVGQTPLNGSLPNFEVIDRSQDGQGGFQLIGLALSVGIGIEAGLMVGFSTKCCSEESTLFSDDSNIVMGNEEINVGSNSGDSAAPPEWLAIHQIMN